MIDFRALPIVGNYYEPADRLYRSTMDIAVKEGRTARACGIPKDRCPPFIDPDMAISWKMGWRWEDEARAAKTPLTDGNGNQREPT